ncbi:helix-turn-helix transcriptional regulator [Xanthobacter sp. DSM 24535]|uniref:helix-turn-helix domain-containing protein n=1 Tax=Roseixanthobacter psychrophilus TaxID=3119917 RepID=UPI0037297750
MRTRDCRRKAAHAAEGRTLLRTFQASIEAIRCANGLSRKAFAAQLGLASSSYFHLMTPKANPSLDYIELIAERAGVEPAGLLARPAATAELESEQTLGLLRRLDSRG